MVSPIFLSFQVTFTCISFTDTRVELTHFPFYDDQALNGLYSEFAIVRIACLNAVKHVPILRQKDVPKNSAVTTLLWMAMYDPAKVRQEDHPAFSFKMMQLSCAILVKVVLDLNYLRLVTNCYLLV